MQEKQNKNNINNKMIPSSNKKNSFKINDFKLLLNNSSNNNHKSPKNV